MSEETGDFMFDDEISGNAEGGHPQMDDPVATLSWSLLDEQISEDEFRLLDTLMLSDDAARDTYVGCVQLHNDLMFHFGEQANPVAASGASAKSPVLGFLNDAISPTGVEPPHATDSRS